MPDPLDNIRRLTFNGIDLHRFCPELRDNFGPRFAARTIWGRDGARHEEGANAPRRVRVHLVFAGDEWQAQISSVLGAIIAKPRGKLQHPIFGTFQAVCIHPIEATFNPSQKGACYEVDLIFQEDAYDQRITFERGPAAQAQIVGEQTAAATTATSALKDDTYARFTVGPIAQRYRRQADNAVSRTSAFTSAADTYAAAALAQFNTGAWDPSLDVQLQRLPGLATPSIQALRLLGQHRAYDATNAVHLALKAATDLDLAIRSIFPVPIVYPVPQRMSVYELAGILYPHKTPTQRRALAEQILRTNRLQRPDAIAPDTRVQVPAP